MLNKNNYQYNIKLLNNMIISFFILFQYWNKIKYNSTKKNIYSFSLLLSFFKNLKETDTANIIYGDNKYIWVSRYYKGKDTEPLSLYYDNSNGIVISSEPVTQNYKVFPKNTVIIYNHNGEVVNKINLN
jgi:predicted glutamine amidotransferase